MKGIEPLTSSLPRKRSTPELHRQNRAGDGIRTRDIQLGRLTLYQSELLPQKNEWGEQDSNLRRHQPTDLQSAPFDRFGISPIF